MPNLETAIPTLMVEQGSWWAAESIFQYLCAGRGEVWRERRFWQLEEETVDTVLDFPTLWFERTSVKANAVLEIEGTLCLLSVGLGLLEVIVATRGHDPDALEAAIAAIKKVFPEADPLAKHQVRVTFWTRDSNGEANSLSRILSVPSWTDVQENYAGRTRAAVKKVIEVRWPPRPGSFILWHGKPGTGKTHALRALAWEWREVCSFDYVVDPEAFLGNANYMLRVLTKGSPDEWRCLVLEDTGELLTADAKLQMGQGLSRFLNLTDGLLGQSFKRLVLVTTNEELSTLHKAVSRAGRGLSPIQFDLLDPEESNAWLTRHDCQRRVKSPTCLSDLYAMLGGEEPREMRKIVGFTP